MTSTDASARVAPLTAKRESSPVDAKPPSARSPKDQSRSFIKPLLKSHRELQRPPFDCVALVLQGGGALGAFQAGVYQGLVEANLHPDWVAGISIGAINAALIAGNAPEARLEKLRAFWEQITTQLLFDPFGVAHYWLRGNTGHVFLNRLRAGATLLDPIWVLGLIATGAGGALSARQLEPESSTREPGLRAGILPATLILLPLLNCARA